MTPAGAEATGHGSETPRDFSDYIEKAETKAIGRALAALGYGTQFVESELEGKQGPRPVDSPAQRGNSAQAPQNRSGRAENGSRDNQSRRPAQSRTAPQNAPQPAAPADDVISADQIAFILRLAGEKGFTAETLAAGIAKYFPGSTIETLTSKHAAELIDKLNEAPPKKA